MSPEEILAKIDQAIGPPESESPEEHEKRLVWVAREGAARRARRESTDTVG
jgi:hypothetical protein